MEEEIKRKLVESGVIGRVLDDFNPRLKLFLSYGRKRISLGEQLTLAEVQRLPNGVRHQWLDPEIHATFNQGKPVAIVMTDPDAPGGEYLHWVVVYDVFIRADNALPWVEMVAYQPPRPGARMVVFTFFQAADHFSRLRPTLFETNSTLRILSNANDFQPIGLPISRENFSTINFVETNAVGSVPLGAAFFNIRYDSEDEN